MQPTFVNIIPIPDIQDEALLAEAADLLGELQWAASDSEGGDMCPSCPRWRKNPEGCPYPSTHAADCRLHNLLQRLKARLGRS